MGKQKGRDPETLLVFADVMELRIDRGDYRQFAGRVRISSAGAPTRTMISCGMRAGRLVELAPISIVLQVTSVDGGRR